MSVTGAVGAQQTRGRQLDATARTRHVPGEPGLWVLLFGDMTVFAVFFAIYLNRRGQNEALFAQSQIAMNQTLGAINTLVLLISSMLIVFATLAFRDDKRRKLTVPLTVAGALVGSLFVIVKLIEYHEKVAAGHTPSANEFFMYFFVLTGLHLFHVIVGLLVLTVLSIIARRTTPTRGHIAFFEGGACFWHMVDLLWLVIFPLLYLVY